MVLKPRTPARAVLPFLELCSLVLVMTVEPGFGGQKFMADMMPKLREVRGYIDERPLQPVMQFADSDGLRRKMWEGSCSIGKAVSYTHLDVYKRQALGQPSDVVTMKNGVLWTYRYHKAKNDFLGNIPLFGVCLLYTSSRRSRAAAEAPPATPPTITVFTKTPPSHWSSLPILTVTPIVTYCLSIVK